MKQTNKQRYEAAQYGIKLLKTKWNLPKFHESELSGADMTPFKANGYDDFDNKPQLSTSDVLYISAVAAFLILLLVW